MIWCHDFYLNINIKLRGVWSYNAGRSTQRVRVSDYIHKIMYDFKVSLIFQRRAIEKKNTRLFEQKMLSKLVGFFFFVYWEWKKQALQKNEHTCMVLFVFGDIMGKNGTYFVLTFSYINFKHTFMWWTPRIKKFIWVHYNCLFTNG